MPTKIDDEELSMCDECGCEFAFDTGTIVDGVDPIYLLLCPKCYKKLNESHEVLD